MSVKRKKRILFVGEASYIATGFGTYWNEVLRRIHDTQEFEIAELGSYSSEGDPKIQQIPWKFYPVAPRPDDEASKKAYNSKRTHQFGEWRFEDVCIDFQPDIVCGIRDWWMDEFVLRSPLRKYFKFLWMPTIDGFPQKEAWLDSYEQCDGVLTYSEWGMDLLKKYGRESTKLITVASPGADLDMFSPVPDKKQHKAKLGIDPETLIVGTIMRNQKRKLYYDLIEAFADWVYKNKNKGHLDLVKRTFLYLHTSYPDVGYDIGRAVQEFKLGNKVLMTYLCTQCGTAFPAFFTGQVTTCKSCRKPSAHPPNASHHCPRNVLANIINTFDIYVQYSICEGWGMPLTEAQACGIPTMAVKYSAMEDHLKNPGSITIEVERFFYEAIIETEQRRALPSNKDFVAKLDSFLKRSDLQRDVYAKKTRDHIVEPVETYGQDEKLPRRGWDRTAAIWANVLREQEIYDPADTWEYPRPRVHQPDLRQPKKYMNNSEFVRWAISDILDRPELVYTYFAAEWITALNTGFKVEVDQRIPVDRNRVIEYFLNLINHRNEVEQRRVNRLQQVDSNKVNAVVI